MSEPTFVILRNRVADYDRWKRVFDGNAAAREDGGLALVHLWRAVEDERTVLMLFRVEDMNAARRFFASPALAEARERAGILEKDAFFVHEVRA